MAAKGLVLNTGPICKDMKNKGFTFIGSRIIYAFMQAIGMVNDHPSYCFRYNKTATGLSITDIQKLEHFK